MVTGLLLKSSLSFSLVGSWWFEAAITEQARIFAPFTNGLIMCAEYKADGTSRLLWYFDKQPGFCERTGTYKLEGGLLKEEVTAVNEKNNVECDTDPDMTVGTVTETQVREEGGKMHWKLAIAEQKVDYVFRPIAACPTAGSPPP